MQPTPVRLSQALWTAFRAAKPTHHQSLFPRPQYTQVRQTYQPLSRQIQRISIADHVRFYSDSPKDANVEKKVEEVKRRIDKSLDARADLVQDAEPTPQPQKEETIVHTLPEASSIVHEKESSPEKPQSSKHSEKDRPSTNWSEDPNIKKYTEWASSQWQSSPLPSQIASLRSRASKQFSSTMDNLQSQIVVAAHHLNDLTGYSAIERLKKEIENQENEVKAARQNVKDSREKYSETISQRSATQREVNDLLHRKHSWSPTDLERFTNLYRSDHVNEQAEQKSHQQLSDAEAQYEEASTRLAKSILARYHEEQIWSDKIRQMSTWGTWGLMGLNVLLFIVFQIAIEPWRRRRLVKGFEEKVQKALDEKEKNTNEQLAVISAAQQQQSQRDGDRAVAQAVKTQPEGVVAAAAENIAELIADAVTGATGTAEDTTEAPKVEDIENAAEIVTEKELEGENQAELTPAPTANSEDRKSSTTLDSPEISPLAGDDTPLLDAETPSLDTEAIPPQPQTWQEQLEANLNSAIRVTQQTYAYYRAQLARQFTEKEHVVLSKRELTSRVFEGVAAGVAMTCGVMFVLLRSR